MPHSISFSALLLAYNTNQLVPGQWYLINDFVTTWLDHNTSSVLTSNEVEPLLIQAVSENKFSHLCMSSLYPEDIIFYDITDTREGATKGRISRRFDTKLNNNIPTDWRHITNKRYAIKVDETIHTYIQNQSYNLGDIVVYPINDTDFYGVSTTVYSLWLCIRTKYNWNSDISANFVRLPYNNREYIAPNKNTINVHVSVCGESLPVDPNDYIERSFFNNYSGGSNYNNYIDDSVSPNIVIGDNFIGNKIGFSCNGLSFGTNCQRNEVGAECFSILFFSDCQENKLEGKNNSISFYNSSYSNIVEKQVRDTCFLLRTSYNKISFLSTNNYIGINSSFNTLKFGSNSNVIDQFCFYTEIGNNSSNNSFEFSSSFNKIGNNSSGNSFETGSNFNKIGNTSSGNSFEASSSFNEIGDVSSGNKIGSSSNHNTFIGLCNNIILGSNSSNNKFELINSGLTFGANLVGITFRNSNYNNKDFTNTSGLYGLTSERYTEVVRTNNGNFFLRYLEDSGNTSITQLI